MSIDEIQRTEAKIADLQEELKIGKEVFKKRQHYFEKFLKVGDIVYISGSYDDYYPQEILHIDAERAQLHVLEVSIGQRSVLQDFYMKSQGRITQLDDVIDRLYN